jgi:hypothetical protein
MRAKPVAVLAIAAASLAVGVPAASATFHEMQIREVYPGSLLNSEYVELQMWAPGQNLVGGHKLTTYGPTGTLTSTDTFPANVTGAANQSTLVLATPAAEAQFGIVADAPLPAADQLLAAAGAVCWESLDCVSWGSFSGALPSPAGTPAVAIPDGMALRRTIAPGCATLLEPGDDHNNSAADFVPVAPGPRPNSVPPSEVGCSGSGPTGPGPTGKPGPPETSLSQKPPKRTHDSTPSFRFSASEAGSSFECRIDSKPFRACKSPFTAKRLAPGHHRFSVRARDSSGARDDSPAAYAFTVLRPRR